MRRAYAPAAPSRSWAPRTHPHHHAPRSPPRCACGHPTQRAPCPACAQPTCGACAGECADCRRGSACSRCRLCATCCARGGRRAGPPQQLPPWQQQQQQHRRLPPARYERHGEHGAPSRASPLARRPERREEVQPQRPRERGSPSPRRRQQQLPPLPQQPAEVPLDDEEDAAVPERPLDDDSDVALSPQLSPRAPTPPAESALASDQEDEGQQHRHEQQEQRDEEYDAEAAYEESAQQQHHQGRPMEEGIDEEQRHELQAQLPQQQQDSPQARGVTPPLDSLCFADLFVAPELKASETMLTTILPRSVAEEAGGRLVVTTALGVMPWAPAERGGPVLKAFVDGDPTVSVTFREAPEAQLLPEPCPIERQTQQQARRPGDRQTHGDDHPEAVALSEDESDSVPMVLCSTDHDATSAAAQRLPPPPAERGLEDDEDEDHILPSGATATSAGIKESPLDSPPPPQERHAISAVGDTVNRPQAKGLDDDDDIDDIPMVPIGAATSSGAQAAPSIPQQQTRSPGMPLKQSSYTGVEPSNRDYNARQSRSRSRTHSPSPRHRRSRSSSSRSPSYSPPSRGSRSRSPRDRAEGPPMEMPLSPSPKRLRTGSLSTRSSRANSQEGVHPPRSQDYSSLPPPPLPPPPPPVPPGPPAQRQNPSAQQEALPRARGYRQQEYSQAAAQVSVPQQPLDDAEDGRRPIYTRSSNSVQSLTGSDVMERRRRKFS